MRKYSENDIERIIASRDAVAYKHMIDATGREVELPELYELGDAIIEESLKMVNPPSNTGIPGSSEFVTPVAKVHDYFNKGKGLKFSSDALLRQIYRGMQNLNIPTPIFGKLDTHEILALYAGIADIKQNNYFGLKRASGGPDNVDTLISAVHFVQEKGYPKVSNSLGSIPHLFETKKGDQIARLQHADQNSVAEMLQSVRKPYLPPGSLLEHNLNYLYEPTVTVSHYRKIISINMANGIYASHKDKF